MQVDNGTARIARDEDVDIDALKAQMADVVVLALIRPREIGGTEVAELTFEEPTGYHMEMSSKAATPTAQVEVSFKVLGECTGLAPDEVKKLGSRDLTRLGQVLAYFLPDVRGSAI